MNEKVLNIHNEHTGVLSMKNNIEVRDGDELSLAYTPGVAYLSELIKAQPDLAKQYTMSGKTIAVITDGTAVLGLGNVGPQAGLPIVEGKALLYKCLSGVDAFPLCLKQDSVDSLVTTIQNFSLSFAGIHLEDIKAPECFEIKEKLEESLSVPVYHDDQEGTAMIVLAGLINAAKVAGKQLTNLSVVINGVGASGVATARLLVAAGITKLTLVDVEGVLTKKNCSNRYQKQLLENIEQAMSVHTLEEALVGKDVFIGLSDADLVTEKMVGSMAHNPVIFALANPIPEIYPSVARKAGARLIGTGSSKFPNQVNNVLVFPGLFKGLLASGISRVSLDLQLVVAQAIADLVRKPTEDKFLPNVFEVGLADKIAEVVVAYSKKR